MNLDRIEETEQTIKELERLYEIALGKERLLIELVAFKLELYQKTQDYPKMMEEGEKAMLIFDSSS